MSMSVTSAGSPDIVQVLMMRKALAAEKTQNEQLLASLPQQSPASAAHAPAGSAGTFYL